MNTPNPPSIVTDVLGSGTTVRLSVGAVNELSFEKNESIVELVFVRNSIKVTISLVSLFKKFSAVEFKVKLTELAPADADTVWNSVASEVKVPVVFAGALAHVIP